MAEQDAKPSASSASSAGPAKPAKAPKPPNPVWRMMGLPNFRLKLPSRNWSIFLAVTGSWTAAVMYDRREKKKIQRKWAKVVEHIAKEPLSSQQLPRKVSVYLSAPPGDGLLVARDHFHEYIKPILVAAALDWDAVEGRKEGDVRAGLAERIRRLRKMNGEPSMEPLEEDEQELLAQARKKSGVTPFDGIAGDIIIGRHTWKEYVRGLHEGWLGPLDPPTQPTDPVAESITPPVVPTQAEPSLSDAPSSTSPTDDAPLAVVHETPAAEPEKPKEEENKPKKKKQPPPFNTTADYTNAALSPNCPIALGPSAAIPFPHLLGFFNFPIRIYRFLNRRQVAEEVGRQTAAAVLTAFRPFDAPGESHESITLDSDGDADFDRPQWEQEKLLKHEESSWHKSARDRKDDNGKERVWLDDMVLDPRISERMRKFELDSELEERAKQVAREGEAPWWKNIWPKKEETKKPWEGLEGEPMP
ncbi:hypothetical protein P154DRAFT_461138 [Amniculicola lignicola CBS 123094]|uniref:Mitochondrial import inner membrane translocase subunit TIM54 n=1 Tax=Amniculicola lignicola CBS 123094 TaxID=1392246 RepID=A0A6A5WRC2_9PLEO|nr:hypothetical protein P154DRAFT_461138 [Amniculicola lignicola CBS 123094]